MAVATDSINQAESPEVRTYRRRVWAWVLYDVADHAFITSTSTTFFPPYFAAIAVPAFLEASKTANDPAAVAAAHVSASNIFALCVSIALFVAALVAPVLGAYADITGQRKRLLVVTTVIGGILASLMFTLVSGMWLLGLVLFMACQLALNVALGFNSSLLPYVARPGPMHDVGEMNRVSSLGYAMGYFGGGILLAFNTALYLFSDKLGIDSGTAVRIAFLIVGIWWIAFMLPTAVVLQEPPAIPLAHGSKGNPLADAFTRIRNTLRDIQRYRELFKMLVAFWLYSEGIGAIILLATSYGDAIGLTTTTLITALLMTQFVAFPYAVIYGRIADPESKWRSAYVSQLIWTAVTIPILGAVANVNGNGGTAATFELIAVDQIVGVLFSYFLGRRLFSGLTQWLNTKRAVILGLVIYTILPVWGFFLRTPAEFFMVGWVVGTVQGGTQALSRSIYTRLSPRAKSGEFFGLYGLSEKFAGILGPLLYAVVGALTQNPRASVFSISVFFLLGILVLSRVDVEKGAEIAQAEEAAIEGAHAAD